MIRDCDVSDEEKDRMERMRNGKIKPKGLNQKEVDKYLRDYRGKVKKIANDSAKNAGPAARAASGKGK